MEKLQGWPAILFIDLSDSYKGGDGEVTQSCPTLRDPMDCNLPGSSIHGIFQVRVLEWVAISFSRGSSWPRDRTRVSRIVGTDTLPSEAPGKVHL